jgi:Domain of unknown function (DUF4286)
MIIYNVTTKVNWAIHDEWLQWMRQQHVPQILKTGCFFESRILRLLETDDEDGPTYAVQYHAFGVENYHTYIEHYAAAFRQDARELWGDQIISFRSVMEVLH